MKRDMGKRAGLRNKSAVDQYRRQLGKHEKHLATSKSRDLIGGKAPKNTRSGGSGVDERYVLIVGAILLLLLIVVGVVYFIGFMGVVQLLYDAVEVVISYWRGPVQPPVAADITT